MLVNNWKCCLSVFERAINNVVGVVVLSMLKLGVLQYGTSYGTLVHGVERRHEMAGRNDTPER